MTAGRISLKRIIGGTTSFLAAAALIALFFAFRRHEAAFRTPHLSVSARRLPYYGFCSFYRMMAAYAAALAFSLFYGTTASKSRAYERIMIPAIDIAQSVPVIGFFPAAIYFFVALAPGRRAGVEMAAIFLIFTSMAWNMALGVFESVRTIPTDSLEALDALGASRWLKLKRLILPACVPKLVYNSILSWVAGWYYLIACEIISVGPAQHYRLPGLGSFLMSAADKGRAAELTGGIATLLAIIVLMDLVAWQPLSLWAEKFRYEFAASNEPMRSLGVLDVFGEIGPFAIRTMRRLMRPPSRLVRAALALIPSPTLSEYPALGRVSKAVRMVVLGAFLLLFAYGLMSGLSALVGTLIQPWPAATRQIPAATAASILRLFVAYVISLAWTIPCAIAASENQRFARRLAPVAEIVGSIPATALFPLIVVFVIHVTGGMNLASILLILTGMQWYLLFNLLAGASQIPADLREAARSFGLSRVDIWRKLIFPAMVPSLLTGSITAWGGGWNALILSEYFVYRDHTYEVFGLGALLDRATYQTGNSVMILLTLLSMVLVVILLNRLVWRRLYDVATERYRIDY